MCKASVEGRLEPRKGLVPGLKAFLLGLVAAHQHGLLHPWKGSEQGVCGSVGTGVGAGLGKGGSLDGLKDLGGLFQPERVSDSVICGLEMEDHSPVCAAHLIITEGLQPPQTDTPRVSLKST